MVGKLSELITGEQVVAWLLIAFLVVYFIYKEFPEFKKRITKGAIKEKADEITNKTVSDRLDAIDQKIAELSEKTDKRFGELNDKLARDYDRINVMEKEQKEIKRMHRSSLEERGLIMRALLALMEGAPDNEAILQSEKEIREYLIQQAHTMEET